MIDSHCFPSRNEYEFLLWGFFGFGYSSFIPMYSGGWLSLKQEIETKEPNEVC